METFEIYFTYMYVYMYDSLLLFLILAYLLINFIASTLKFQTHIIFSYCPTA